MISCDSVIVHYGPYEPTLDVARAALDWSSRVVVVANDLQSRPESCPPAVMWIVPVRNLGFGEALNLACAGSNADVLLALNNDIAIGSEDIQRCLLEFADPLVAVVGPVLRFANGGIQSAGGRLTPLLGLPAMDLSSPPAPQDCIWVTGAVMLLRRRTLATLKMDGTYFLGCEDVDFCLRVADAGMRVRIVPSADAIHHGSGVITGPRWHYYFVRNPVWLSRKRRPDFWWTLTLGFQVLRTLRVATADTLKGRGTARTLSCIHGVADSIRQQPTILPWPDEPRPARWLEW